MRRSWLPTGAALLVASVLVAGAAGAAPFYQLLDEPAVAPTAPRPETPDEILRAGIERLSEFLDGHAAGDPGLVRAFLEREIADFFDFRTMSRWAAGPIYAHLTEPQQDRFSAKLRGLFLSAVARNLGSYATPLPRIDVYPTRSARWGDERTVRARVTPPAGYTINMDFRFYRTSDGWKVFDIAANGASAVTYYRRYFAAQVSASGPAALYN